jgi:hypothetical protein
MPQRGTIASLHWIGVFVISVGTLAGGCAKEQPDGPQPEQARDPAHQPVLLIGMDGIEWNVVIPMLREGRLPAIASLMERGTYGLLHTLKPTLSPPIWTTIATGKMPQEHGILDFATISAPGQPPKLLTNRDRRTKAIWNIATDYDKRVAVIGWWMTFPVEPVNGIMVAQTNTSEQIYADGEAAIWKGQLISGVPGQVYPPERQAEIMSLVTDIHDSVPALTTGIFGKFESPLSELGRRMWGDTQWAFRADAAYARIAEALLKESEPFDLIAVYFGGSDVVGHRFWRHMQPHLYTHQPPEDELTAFRGVIRDYYAYLDGIVGRLVSQAGPNARVFIVSDHGMKPINTEARFHPDDPPADLVSGHHQLGEPGIIIAAGPDIRSMPNRIPPAVMLASDLRGVAGVLDLAPTILALMDIPVGQDMPGKVRTALFEPQFSAQHPLKTVPTHDTEAWREAHRNLAGEVPGEDERLEQLRALGYIQDPDEPPEQGDED